MPESALFERLERELKTLTEAGLRRRRRTVEDRSAASYTVDGRKTINFASNDYLGLADHPAITDAAIRGARRWGVGSGASHLVSGHFAVHEALERRLAAFVGCASSLLFSTGYMVNSGVIPALVGRGDAIFADRLIHASLVDGALLSRADLRRYPHGDLAALEKALATSRAPRKLIVTDSVFSMDGDIAPLPELLALAERFDAWLMVDDCARLRSAGPPGSGRLRRGGPLVGAHRLYRHAGQGRRSQRRIRRRQRPADRVAAAEDAQLHLHDRFRPFARRSAARRAGPNRSGGRPARDAREPHRCAAHPPR